MPFQSDAVLTNAGSSPLPATDGMEIICIRNRLSPTSIFNRLTLITLTAIGAGNYFTSAIFTVDEKAPASSLQK